MHGEGYMDTLISVKSELLYGISHEFFFSTIWYHYNEKTILSKSLG